MAILFLLSATGCATSSPAGRTGHIGGSPQPARSGHLIARGLATYYGGKYQRRPTASGERFDKEALTAAHADLPFGRRVRVTNTETGRSVVVRINDRFKPFKGRIIDLSERAFRQIAPLERGVIPVTVESVP
ncbi:MAG: septal ring lytic transglycosylase RlpA family protein [Verrucomicrobia bacterium]|nr:septal ring lytic transglycosylase RlpA family protein [Verrucomicrobiota bacterium]